MGVRTHFPLVLITLLGSVWVWASSGKVDLKCCSHQFMVINTFYMFLPSLCFGQTHWSSEWMVTDKNAIVYV